MTLPRMLLVALLATCSIPASAHAQHDEEAHGLFTAGAAAFQAGRYDEALGYFQHAYDLSQRPELLFNIGQSADRARQDDIALDAFRRYLAAVPDVPDREQIEGRIRVLERAAAAHAVAPAPETPPEPPTEPPAVSASEVPAATEPRPVDAPGPASPGPDVGGIVLTVSGGAVVVVGAILLGVGAPDFYPPPPGALATDNDRWIRSQTLVGAGGAALGVGLILGVVGVILLGTSTAPSASALRLTPNGLSVSF